MGTNYYYHHKPAVCDECGFETPPIHIGKLSHGWKFAFRAYSNIRSWKDWKRLLSHGIVYDEYGDWVGPAYFVALVENTKDGLPSDHEGWYEDEDGFWFCEGEFS